MSGRNAEGLIVIALTALESTKEQFTPKAVNGGDSIEHIIQNPIMKREMAPDPDLIS